MKISISQSISVYVYSNNCITLMCTFPSTKKAAENFHIGNTTVLNYIKNGKLFKEKWFLSRSFYNPISKDLSKDGDK